MTGIPKIAFMGLRTPAAVLLALLSLAMPSLAACPPGGPPESLAARVNPLPAGVSGPGAAVFLARVPDRMRDDMLGLIRVGRFGDALAKGAWVRRHAEVALGDPALPIAVRGLAGDPRDAVLAAGNVIDAQLPQHVFLTGTFSLGRELSATTGRCVLVRTDGRMERPEPEAQCERAPNGGAYWYAGQRKRIGGIDLRTGTASPALVVPEFPAAVSPDGRHLAYVRGETLAVIDVRDGTAVTAGGASRGGPDVFTPEGYVTILRADDRAPALVVAGFHGEVRGLVDDVGTVAFVPDGRRALAMAGRGRPRLVVADLRTGALTPVKGFPASDGGAKIVVAGEHALVAVLARDADIGDPRPADVWEVDLRQARARRAVTVPRAQQATPLPGGTPAGQEAPVPGARLLAGLRFAPDRGVVAVSGDGVAVAGPAGTSPVAALPGRRILFSGEGPALTAVGEPGGAVRIATGARKDQVVAGVLPTADGRHLIVSLRPRDNLAAGPGPDDEIVLARLDGGAPLVLYRGVVLASVGL
ncbi:hypothetical protein AB0O28_36230 [Microbispora sp. NPDC088329]|uniref:hypothetical protein n=1 Tax=Microbispora sp. NPDC088329 TaxID=3154869 RepID=UPI003426AC7F